MARVPKKGALPWYQTLDAETKAELDSIRTRFWRGELGRATKTGLSHAVSETLMERGILIGYAGVLTWLESGKPKA